MANLEDRFRRLLLLVPYVLRNNGATVDEVSERFGITRSELVADLNLLFMCGLPGYGPGDLIEAYIDGDQVWIRMADYFARPMRLTPAEGLMLYAGGQALAAVSGPDPALERAMEQLSKALTPGALERVSVGLEAPEELAVVKAALESKHRLHLVYQSQSKDEVTERDVDPWALLLSEGRWYLLGYCHRVNDERIFRVDRMRSVLQLEDAAGVPDDFDLSQYDSVYFESENALTVTLDIAPRANWVCDYYPLLSQEPLEDGWIRIRLKAGGVAWLERLLLRLGPEARIIEPDSLKEKLKGTAASMARRYASSKPGS
ncbi:MAG TPA: WYL domain-containing protein [Actinomycetota bacterium]|nr:WYL domain-containing protein [Actinomycetota bacterium]